ncbi:hypothetical protein NHG28_06555 [Aerococcaceae bacterium NML201209]|nr:hypothetical protein [Aerococcaceae bacterium NML201209]
MSYHEFVYEHDLESVFDLIERYMVYHGIKPNCNSKETSIKENAWTFFV